jgi:hypothetical protein
MSKKNWILMLTLLTVISIISVVPAQSVPMDWHPGIYTFGFKFCLHEEIIDNINGASQDIEITTSDEFYYNITAINILTETYGASITDRYGTSSISTYDYGMDDYISDYLSDITDIIDFEYEWDYGTNTTKLTSFDFGYDTYVFLEADWFSFNEAFREVLNESTIIDTVADPYDPIIHNITLGDFLDSLPAYSLNGKQNFADGVAQFTDTNTVFSWYVDLSSVYYVDEYNATLGYDVYYPTDFTMEFAFQYTKGGILKRYEFTYTASVTQNDQELREASEEIIAYGGLKKISSNFAYLAFIPAMFTAVFIARLIKKGKKGEKI